MPNKSVLQTIGTISSVVLLYLTLTFTDNMPVADIQNITGSFQAFATFLLPVFTLMVMIATGFSYYKSRIDYEGTTRILYFLVALAHTVLAPVALVVSIMKIHFGPSGWAVLIGALLLIYWVSQRHESESK